MCRAPDSAPNAGGLYVHVPFCRGKCAYCDFRSAPVGRAVPRPVLDRYLGGIAREAALRAPLMPRIATLFLGGGTPSLLPDDAIARLLATLRDHFDIEYDAEVTLEANPCDLADPERPARLAALGVRRLSIGVQSLSDRTLARLGRPHDAASARRALSRVAAAKIPFSADLLLGAPGDPPEAFARDAAEIAALGARHLSLYALSYPEGTPLARDLAEGRIAASGPDAEAARLESAHEAAAALGLPPYEVSNFARTPADRSRHNLGYWERRPYLGLGPAAHSHLPAEERRFWNAATLGGWLAALDRGGAPEGEERLPPGEAALEFLFLGLRHAGGVDCDAVAAVTGIDPRTLNAGHFARWSEAGYGAWDGRRFLPTPAGMRRADGLAAALDL